MSFKQLLKKGALGDQKDRTPERTSPPPGNRVPSSGRSSGGRVTSVLYVGDTRETRLMTGAFSYDHPQLAIEVSADLPDATARLAEPNRFDALVIGWSVPESDAAGLISQLRAKSSPLAIIAVGEHALEVLREAGADQCVQKGGSLLSRLPVAIEEAVKSRTGSIDAPPADQSKSTPAIESPSQQVASLTQELASVRAKESRLRALVDKLPACVVRVSPDGLVLATNAVAISLLGASQPTQLLRKPFETLVREGARAKWTEFVARVSDGEQRSCEISITALDGVDRDLEAVGVPSPGEGNGSGSVLVVLRDISDRKRLEASLEEAIRRSAPMSVDEASRSLGFEPSTPADSAPTAAASLPDARVLRDLETDLHHIAGRARTTFDELGALLREAASQHDAVFTRQVDAYARVKAEQLEHWRSYEAFVQAAASGVFRVSLDGTLQATNRAFAAMLGFAAPEELTDTRTAIGQLTDESRWRSAVERWRAGATDAAETYWRRKDATLTSLRLHGRLMANPNGEGEYLEVVAEDLGAQRTLETQLRRARRWEDAARVTSGIAADLTHLVDVIKEGADRLASESAHDEKARQRADAIGQAVARASALSRQLVAFGRKEARDPKTFDLNDTVRGLERVVRRLIDEHIDIALALAPDAGAVEVSEPALEEAVVHLSVAAASALPAGGRIELATRASDVETTDDIGPDGLKPGHYGLVSITASGWGLDTEIQRDDVTKGVTSARRSIGRVGGSVSAIAVAGASLTFRIYVPAVQGTEEFDSEEYAQDVDTTSSSSEATPGK